MREATHSRLWSSLLCKRRRANVRGLKLRSLRVIGRSPTWEKRNLHRPTNAMKNSLVAIKMVFITRLSASCLGGGVFDGSAVNSTDGKRVWSDGPGPLLVLSFYLLTTRVGEGICRRTINVRTVQSWCIRRLRAMTISTSGHELENGRFT